VLPDHVPVDSRRLTAEPVGNDMLDVIHGLVGSIPGHRLSVAFRTGLL
jgi:hypothetical protein